MLRVIEALVFALVLALLGERTYAAYQWKVQADEAMKLATVSAQYLFTATGVKGPDGKPLSRADLLDLLLSRVVQGASSSPTASPSDSTKR